MQESLEKERENEKDGKEGGKKDGKKGRWLERSLEKKGVNRKSLEKWFQPDNLIILILSGVLLFIIALPTKSSESKQAQTGDTAQGSVQQDSAGGTGYGGSAGNGGTGYGSSADNNGTAAGGTTSNGTGKGTTANGTGGTGYGSSYGAGTEYDYAVYLEQKLEETLAGVSGVGKVSVMVTLQSSEELVVEKDAPVSRSNTNEADSEGGSRTVSQVDTQETTIYRTEGSDSEPYVIKTILPKVEGVLVVAQGADTGGIDKSITEIVQALFGVEAHKVKVVPMESGK